MLHKIAKPLDGGFFDYEMSRRDLRRRTAWEEYTKTVYLAREKFKEEIQEICGNVTLEWQLSKDQNGFDCIMPGECPLFYDEKTIITEYSFFNE